MNGGGGGSRVQAGGIPAGVRKTIENIREIAGNHTDEEVYAMLRECSMDPNETCQKLLLQDTFHEVKRKRDKKKEGGNNKETVDPKFRPANQGPPGRRWGTGRFSSRFIQAKEARNMTPVVPKENNGINDKVTEKGKAPVEPGSPNKEAKASTSNPSPIITDFPLPDSQTLSPKPSSTDPKATNPSPSNSNPPTPNKSKTKSPHSQPSPSHSKSPLSKSKSPQSVPVASVPTATVPVQGAGILAKPPEGKIQPAAAAVCSSTADPVLHPSHSPRAVSTIRRPVGSQRNNPNREMSQAAPTVSHGRLANSRPSSSSKPSSSSRPSSSNYNNRGPLSSGPQRGGPNKEWKPKSTTVAPPAQQTSDSTTTATLPEPVSRSVPALDLTAAPTPNPNLTAVACSIPTPDLDVETAVADSVKTVEVKLAELQVSPREHVIIPNHLQVPDSEKYGISFGSFDQIVGFAGPTVVNDKKISEPAEMEPVEEPASSIVNEQEPSPVIGVMETPNAELAGQNEQLKEEKQINNMESQFSLADSSFDQVNHVIMPNQSQPLDLPDSAQVNHVLSGNQSQLLDVREAPAHQAQLNDGSAARQPNMIVQQPIDLASNYYSQLYRPAAESDGRFSPFLAPGGAIKYGNISVLTGQTGQISQEMGNQLMMSSAGSAALATPTGGIIQTSLSIPQQTVPVFRHTVGTVQLSHYPPNYLPYNQYAIPPFYVHPSLAFPQQAPAGGIYTAGVPAGTVQGQQVRYKPGTVGTNVDTVGNVYGAYGLGYTNVNSALTSVSSNGESDDMAASQFKENNNMYITGQATEGMWMQGGPGRADLSNIGSFYGLTPQGAPAGGQHLAAFSPQMGAQMYPPAQHHHHQLLHQPVEMITNGSNNTMYQVGPNVSAGPQRSPITWAASY